MISRRTAFGSLWSTAVRRAAAWLCVAQFVCVSGGTFPALSAVASDEVLRLSLDLPSVRHQFANGDFLTALPSPEAFGVDRIVAFEDHPDFAYLLGIAGDGAPYATRSPDADLPSFSRRLIFIRPRLLIVDDRVDTRAVGKIQWRLTATTVQSTANQELHGELADARFRLRSLLPPAAEWDTGAEAEGSQSAARTLKPAADEDVSYVRLLHVVTIDTDNAPFPVCSLKRQAHSVQLEIVDRDTATARRTVRLTLPDLPSIGRVEIVGADGEKVLASRFFPAGVFPPDLDAAQRRLQWDLPYQIEGLATWDIGRPSPELQKRVENGEIKPCRVVEIGCGTGNDAIYLARQGFDVTAIDISPTALNIAEKKAAEAGVAVQWLLADALQPPDLEKFDFVYDRGCYHEVRQHHAKAYVAALHTLAREDAKILILAGNANKDSYWRFHGPPRVREQDIRSDFAVGFELLQLREFRFEPLPPDREGALAWSILLAKRRADVRPDERP